jgi:hypothetical protein
MAIGMVRRTGGGGSCDGVHGAIWKPVWGTLERYWQPSYKKREGAPPCQERGIWRRRSPIAERRGRKRQKIEELGREKYGHTATVH